MKKQPDVFRSLRTRFAAEEQARREIHKASNDAIHHAKRAIFALHRAEEQVALEKIAAAEHAFAGCEKLIKKYPALSQEGPFCAALEEYAEALLFQEYLRLGIIAGRIHARALAPTVFIGGLCDATGEMVRHALRCATKGDDTQVAKAKDIAETVVALLLDLDLTGALRQKADQAKRNLHALEQMLYDLSLRTR